MTFPIKQGDREPAFSSQLSAGGAPIDLTGRTVRFLMRHQTTGVLKVAADAEIVSATEGIVRYAWEPTDTDTPGLYRAEWEITSAGLPRTVPSKRYLYIEVTPDLDEHA